MSDMQDAEQKRQDAELLREEHEVRRRIGEGGPDQHVEGNLAQGRVEAEAARVVAEEHRRDLRKFYLKMATAIALPLAFIALIPAMVGLYLVQKEADQRVTENRKALVYICSTTSVLDNLVVEVAKSVRLNLNSGFYDQLIAQGVLPPDAKTQAKINLTKYDAAHDILSDTKPCQEIQ